MATKKQVQAASTPSNNAPSTGQESSITVPHLPTHKAISVVQLEPGKWATVIHTIEDGVIVSTVESRPNLRAIAIENGKVEFTRLYLGA